MENSLLCSTRFSCGSYSKIERGEGGFTEVVVVVVVVIVLLCYCVCVSVCCVVYS